MVYDMPHLSFKRPPYVVSVIKHNIKSRPEWYFSGSLLLTWECALLRLCELYFGGYLGGHLDTCQTLNL